MRTVKFTEDHTFNVTGGAGGRVSKKAGQTGRYPDWLADKLVHHWQVATYHDMQPQETKVQTKVDFEDLPEHERLSKAGFASLREVKEASDEELLDVKGIGPKTLQDIRGIFE